tara:strand:- start:27 stop:506 length:480 start_codon:yes stop_codon:yes gene_type:complete
MSKMNTENISLSRNNEIQEDECPICYNVLGTNNVAISRCNHTFCLSCYVKHTRNSNACPMCRELLDPSIIPQQKVEIVNMEISSMEIPNMYSYGIDGLYIDYTNNYQIYPETINMQATSTGEHYNDNNFYDEMQNIVENVNVIENIEEPNEIPRIQVIN